MRVKWVICRRNCRYVVPDDVKVQTCWNCFFFSPFVKQGGSHSWSRSTFMNSSMVSWLVGVSPNSTSLTKEKSQQVKKSSYNKQSSLLNEKKSTTSKTSTITHLFLRVCSHTFTTPTISLMVRRKSCTRAATRSAENKNKKKQRGEI